MQDPALSTLHYYLARSWTTHTSLPLARSWTSHFNAILQDLELLKLHYYLARSWSHHTSLPSCKILTYSHFTAILQDPHLLTLHCHLARSSPTHTSLRSCKMLTYSHFTAVLQDAHLLTLLNHRENPNNSILTRLRAEQPSHQGSLFEWSMSFYFLWSVQWVAAACFMGQIYACSSANRTFQFCTEAMNDSSRNFTAVCLQGVEINSAQGQLYLLQRLFTQRQLVLVAHTCLYLPQNTISLHDGW